jgi:hypothetical protein
MVMTTLQEAVQKAIIAYETAPSWVSGSDLTNALLDDLRAALAEPEPGGETTNGCAPHLDIRNDRDAWMSRYVKAREEEKYARRRLDVLVRAHAILGEAYTNMRIERNKLRARIAYPRMKQ